MVTLIDAGPLYAYINRRDYYHDWAVEQVARLDTPFYTCEAVLSEVHFLLASTSDGSRRLIELLGRGVMDLSFSYADHFDRVNELMRAYENVPMSFADACLVRMAEVHPDGHIFTTDGDFHIYRKHGDASLAVLTP